MTVAKYDICPSEGCGVQIGIRHERICSIARCKEHGNQLISCIEDGLHTPSIFRGEFPGTSEAIANGWFTKLVDGKGWIHCEAEDEGAKPDLNRVIVNLLWDPNSETFK